MSIQVEGTIERQEFGAGVWALVSGGATYELHQVPPELQQSGLKVRITGRIREDIMTVAMIGPVLEVQAFQAISGKETTRD